MAHPLDTCLFMNYNRQGELQGMISMHVDDLLTLDAPKSLLVFGRFAQQVEVPHVEELCSWQDRAN